MNISLDSPFLWLPDSTDAENEIRRIFSQHWEKVKGHLITTVTDINTWRDRVIGEINKYADDQIHILTADYGRLQFQLNKTCEENLETTRAYADVQNIELFNELCSACRSLEFQMAKLEFVNGTMNGPKVITVEEKMPQEKTEISSILISNKLEEKTTTDIHDSHDERKDLSVEAVSSISNEMQSKISEIKPSNNNTPNNYVMLDRNPFDKCPICFMIFSKTMTYNDRSEHINEHCTDN